MRSPEGDMQFDLVGPNLKGCIAAERAVLDVRNGKDEPARGASKNTL